MIRYLLTALLLCVGASLAPAASAQALHAELLLTDGVLDGAQDGPPASAPVLQRAVARDPSQLAEFLLGHRQRGYWLRLTSDRDIPASEGRLLVLEGAHALAPVTFYAPAAAPRVVAESGHGGSLLLRRGWVLPLPSGWPAANVAYLHVRGMTNEPLRLRFSTAAELTYEQRAQARFSAATFTPLLIAALALAVIWVMFRDMLYLHYAGYLVCIGLFLPLLSGDATEIGGLRLLASTGLTGQWALATLAVIFQLAFSVHFLELPRRLPRAAIVVRSLLWLHIALVLVLLIGRERVHGWYDIVGNLLLVAAAPVVLVIAAMAWRKGTGYAGYYLLGWVPLMAIAALSAIHQLGVMNAAWAEQALALAAVLEAGVLALAVGQHAANRHRLALLARQSAQRDPLTGALNGPGLQQLLESWHRFGARRYGVLLLDFDDFREVNARYGRAVGDAVLQQAAARLRAVLRPDDTVARMDDDGFAILTESDRSECDRLAQRLADIFSRRPFRIDGHEITASASIGVALSQRGESVADLLARAEDALRGAHLAGRGGVGHMASPAQLQARDVGGAAVLADP